MSDAVKSQEERNEENALDEADKKTMSRRIFLRSVMWASTLLTLLTTALSGFMLFWPRKIEGFGSLVRAGKLDDFPVGSVTRVRSGKFYIARLSEHELIALYWKCPHLGCTVPWEPTQNQFVCPCHGSRYNITGQNVAGPAPRPMDYMTVYVDEEGTVIVDTGDIRERDAHRSEHVTRV